MVVDELIALGSCDLGYQDEAKKRFHATGKVVLRRLAEHLHGATWRTRGSVRSNPGGIAVSGEVTLHTDCLYVQLSASPLHRGEFMWRTCRGIKDYVGGRNQWARFAELRDLPALANKMIAAVKEAARPSPV